MTQGKRENPAETAAREAEIRVTLARRRPPCPVDARHDVQWRPAQGVSGAGWWCDVDGYLPDPADPATPNPAAGFVSGERWADQIRRLLRPIVEDPDELELAVADMTAWAVEAGNVRWRQGYAEGALDEAAEVRK